MLTSVFLLKCTMLEECMNDDWYKRLQQCSLDLDSDNQKTKESAKLKGLIFLKNSKAVYDKWMLVGHKEMVEDGYLVKKEVPLMTIAIINFKFLLRKRFKPRSNGLNHSAFIQELEKLFSQYTREYEHILTLKMREIFNEICPRENQRERMRTKKVERSLEKHQEIKI